MTEHVCKWKINVVGSRWLSAGCYDCDRVLIAPEIERRLNAVERLSAGDAKYIAKVMSYTGGSELLLAYAAALDGPDG